ncbi:hypothetical protein BYT27DRAFT_7261836, partial [Phlegmacium glaucopus]
MVAGSRCSTRVSHPSKRVLDPDNSERPNSNSDEKDEDSVDDGHGDGGAANTEGFVSDANIDSEMLDDLEAVEEAYTATKVMGDTDREALANRPKSDRTADIRTIFKRDKEY